MSGAQRKADLYASIIPPAWYVACAEREYRARDELADRAIQVWLPECRVIVSRRRVRTTVDGPLFPGYLFVRGVLTDDWLAAVLGAREVVDLLRMRSLPLVACERQMTTLQRLVAESGGRVLIEAGRVKRGFGISEDDRTLKQGQYVRVLEGPFSGFNALYMEPAGEDRVKILLDIFGRSTELEMDEASVEAVA